MSVGERKYPHPLIALVAVLVTALALSAIIWAGSGWPWRSDVIGEEEGTEEAKTSSYVEFYGVRTVLPHSKYGGVTAANIVLDDSRVTGNALIEYSSCAVNRAVLNNSALTRVRPIENRSWVDLSSVISG